MIFPQNVLGVAEQVKAVKNFVEESGLLSEKEVISNLIQMFINLV